MNRTQYGAAIIVRKFIPLPSTGCACVSVPSPRETRDAACVLASYPVLLADFVVSWRCNFAYLCKGIQSRDMVSTGKKEAWAFSNQRSSYRAFCAVRTEDFATLLWGSLSCSRAGSR